MEDLVPIGAVARALGVSLDTLRRWEQKGEVQFVRRGNRRFLPADELAQLVRGRARAPGSSSARNRLKGVVVEVKTDGLVGTVELACGPFRVLSLHTAEALRDLALQPGDTATAIIKATDVVVERS